MPPKKKGRPSTYTKEMGQTLCTRMALGETMAEITKETGMPSKEVIYQWRQIHPDFDSMYTRAREDQMHAWADQIISFADDGTEDVLRDGDGNPVLKANGDPKLYREHIDRTRLRIDTRKWLMAKILPKVFGDRMAVDATHTVEQKDDAEMIHALQEALHKAGMEPDDIVSLIGTGAPLQ